MARRNIVKEPDAVLHKQCREVTKFDSRLHMLLDDLRDTLATADGVGLAAPQVGVLRRVAIVLETNVEEGEPIPVIELVNPEVIEEKFRESKFIENIVVFGEGQKFAAALIVPDTTFIQSWNKRNRLTLNKNKKEKVEELTDTDIKSLIAKEVKKYNASFGDTEQIKKFEIVNEKRTVESGLLTPTLKVKRKVVQQRYKALIDSMFA
mgnify:CR=1 FL=1